MFTYSSKVQNKNNNNITIAIKKIEDVISFHILFIGQKIHGLFLLPYTTVQISSYCKTRAENIFSSEPKIISGLENIRRYSCNILDGDSVFSQSM